MKIAQLIKEIFIGACAMMMVIIGSHLLNETVVFKDIIFSYWLGVLISRWDYAR
jgi:hypothetical protein